MNNIQLNIVANAQFQQVYAEVTKLKEAMASLQKVSVGGPFAPGIAADIKASQAAFDSAVMSTRAFTMQHVAMADSVTRFGKQLASGKLSLNQYYKIWRDSAKGVSAELDALAASQARLNRSVAIADPLRPGYAKLITDLNGVVTAQEKAIFYQRALNTALHDGAMKLINFGKNTQWMGRQLTVGLTMPVAMLGAALSASFYQVDKELTRMQKVYGTGIVQPTQQALKQIREDVQALGVELAKTLGTSVKETSAMSADLAATGLEGAKLLGATREAIRLATLGELDHQQAMQATVSLQNVYKLSTQGLTEAVDFLNAVENQTSTSLQDLVDAIPRVGPIVAQLGGSFKDTAAMMVAMKEAGVPAAQGANAIKSALSSLINPTKNAENAFAAYKINLNAIATETGGKPILMLKALADQLNKLDSLARAQLIEKLFGKFQFARVSALLDNINKSGTQTATVFGLMGASAADLARISAAEIKTQTESASGKFKKMLEGLKADLLPIGEGFLQSFTRIGNAVDKIVNAVKKIGQALGPVGSILGKVFGTGAAGLVIVGPILMLVGLFSNLIGNIFKAANYLRMFKQGMEAATPSQNAFVAGLHNMRNFYENLDAGIVAARNQMNLMPEAITSNAKAFDILNASIRTLTMQFEALTAAQAASMGMPMSKFMTTPAGARLLPIVARNLGGSIFFNNGNYVPGTGNSDTVPAMLTPGEFVIRKDVAQSDPEGMKALNAGQAQIVRRNAGGPIPGVQYFQNAGEVLALETILANLEKSMPGSAAAKALREKIAGSKSIDKTKEGVAKYFGFETDKSQNVSAIDWVAKNHPRQIRSKYGRSSSPQQALTAQGIKLAKEAGFKISDQGLMSATELINKQLWFDEKVGSWRGVAKAIDEKFGIDLKSGERYGLYGEKITQDGSTILGYVRKPTSGLFGEAEYSTLVSLNNKRAGAGLFGKEIEDFLSYSRSYGNGKISGTATRFLNEMPNSIVDKALAQTINGEIDSVYASKLDKLVKEGKALNDNTDPYLESTLEVFSKYSQSHKELFNSYSEFITKSSAYNPIYISELKAGRGHSGAASIQLSNGVVIPAFKGSKADNSFFFHSIGGFNGGGRIEGRAGGGGVSSNTPYIVGEKGPELFVPGQSGNIIPHFDGGGGVEKIGYMGQTGVIGNVYVPGRLPYAPGLGMMNPVLNQIEFAATQMVAGARLAAQQTSTALITLGKTISSSSIVMSEKTAASEAIIGNNLLGFGQKLSSQASALASKISTALTPITTAMGRVGAKLKGKMDPMVSMGGMMAAPMLINMIPDKVGGSDVSGAKSIASNAMMAFFALKMLGGGAAAAAPYVAGAVVAIGLFTAAMKKMQTDARENANLLKSEFSVSALASQHLGVAVDNLANIHLLSLNTKTGDLTKEMEKNKAAVDALTASYKNATDQQTKDTLKKVGKMSGKELQQFIQDQYATYMASGGDPTKSKQEIAAILNAAGKGNIATLGLNLPTYANSAQALKGQINQALKLPGAGGLYMSAFGGGLNQGEMAASKAAGSAVFNLALTSPSNISKAVKGLDAIQQAVFESVNVFEQFQSQLAKQNPELAKLAIKLHDAGASTTQLAEATSLVNAGFIKSNQQFKLAAESLTYLNELMKAYGIIDKLSTTQTIIKGTASTAIESAQKLIDNKQTLIDQINGEIDKRNNLYDAQMRNIDAQEKQMNLEEEILKARGSGDLIKLAIAQQNMQIQKTKDAMAAAKAAADISDKNRIAALEKEIKDLKTKQDVAGKTGTPDTTGPSQKDAASTWLSDMMTKVQTDAKAFIDDMASSYASILAIVKDPEKAKALFQTALNSMDWTAFNKNLASIYDNLAKIFGDKAAAAMVIDTITFDLQSKLDAALKEGKIKGISADDLKTLVEKVKNAILKVEAGDDPTTKKKVSAAYATFADDLMNAVKKPMTKAEFIKTVQDEFTKLAKAVYNADIHSKNPAVRAKAQADYDYIVGQGSDYIDAVFKQPGAATLAKHRSGFLGLLDNIFNALKAAINFVFGSPTISSSGTVGTTSSTIAKTGNIKVSDLQSKGISLQKGTVFTDSNGKEWIITTTAPVGGVVGVAEYKKAKGGYISKFDVGGHVVGPGTSTSDSIPAMLSNGEYVIKADAVSKYGKPFMDAINNKSYRVPNSSFDKFTRSEISDSINSLTNIGGNTINVYPPQGADANEVANLVITKINQAVSKQQTIRRV